MVQWLRIQLPMQETWIRSLAQEDPTCHREAKPMCHNSEAPVRSRAPKPQLLKPMHSRAHTPQQEKPLQWKAYAPQLESSPHSLQLEKARAQHQRPITVKNKLILNITVIIFSHPSHCSPRQYLHLHHHAITTPSFQEQFFNPVLEISSAQGPTHWE